MENKNRIVSLDYLRALVILLVVMFHDSLTCMKESPSWWYVHNGNVSLLHTLFVVIADTFMMPVLFLISGAVQSIQLIRADRISIVKKRAWRLLIPWMLGVLMVGPYLSLKTANSLGLESGTWLQMITADFWGKLYTQGPYWYLSLLFLFVLLSVALPKKGLESIQLAVGKRKWLLFVFVIAVSALGYGLGSYYEGTDGWVNVGFLWFFQPSRVFTYLACFVVGLLMGDNVLELGLKRWFWGVIALICSFGYLVIVGEVQGNEVYLLGVFYSLTAICFTFFLVGFAKRRLSKENALLAWLSKNSYALYLIHLPIQVIVGSYFIKYNLSSWNMWFLLVGSSLVVVWFSSMTGKAISMIRGRAYDRR